MIKWAGKVGLEEFADFLRQTGVHGAVIALGEGFDAEKFAYYLQIPETNERVSKRGLITFVLPLFPLKFVPL